jgi:hypothetical protein
MATLGTLIIAAGPGLFGLAHDLGKSYATFSLPVHRPALASALIILRCPRIVREPIGATERG